MGMKMSKAVLTMLKLLLVGGLMTYVFLGLQWSDSVREFSVDGQVQVQVSPGFLTYLRNLNLGLFGCGALLYFLTISVTAARWHWLLRANDLRVSYCEALRFTWIGYFFNNLIPGQTGGDVAKAVYIMKHCHSTKLPALVSVLVDRALGLISLLLLSCRRCVVWP